GAPDRGIDRADQLVASQDRHLAEERSEIGQRGALLAGVSPQVPVRAEAGADRAALEAVALEPGPDMGGVDVTRGLDRDLDRVEAPFPEEGEEPDAVVGERRGEKGGIDAESGHGYFDGFGPRLAERSAAVGCDSTPLAGASIPAVQRMALSTSLRCSSLPQFLW